VQRLLKDSLLIAVRAKNQDVCVTHDEYGSLLTIATQTSDEIWALRVECEIRFLVVLGDMGIFL
jgi:hypothetical protein